MDEGRGTIAFFATYRPPVPLDIYSSPYKPNSPSDETKLTDGKSYNYNGQVIPSSALKTILKSKKLATDATVDDVETGRVTGLLFVSERTNNLETLHIGLQFHDKESSKVEVFNFADVYGTFKGTRMEDSGCIAGDYLVYVSTKDRSPPHQPWTAIFKTHLGTGNTDRLTPSRIGQHDLSPSTSPDGKRVAFASFQRKLGWDGEIEDLRTDIYIMNVVDKPNRKSMVINGGWPTWATNDILFFHRNTNTPNDAETRWAVFQLDLRTNPPKETRVTPEGITAVTPAAINETTVAVATMRKKYNINDPEIEREIDEYRHIEIFSLSGEPVIRVTEMVRPKADHFNPFVIVDKERGMRIGYHRCNTDDPDVYSRIGRQFHKFPSPDTEKVDLVRVSGVFPSFSPDGSKLAFVDNEFKALWVADSNSLYIAYETSGANKIFSPVWNSNKDIDRIYVCLGPSFQANEKVEIAMIQNNSEGRRQWAYHPLTGEYNNAFPSTNSIGTKIVYRSTRGHDEDEKKKYKNLFIMDAEYGDGDEIIQITKGKCVDTHCQWSPNDKWIAFASNRGNPTAQAPPGLPDPGFFGIYLTKADDPKFEPIKVVDSGFKRGRELFPGHCVHPCFSPDGRSLVFAADLAAVSVDPISLPLFVHSVRPYGDIFMVNLKMDDISKNKDMDYIRITHSRYENSTATWTKFSTKDPYAKWNLLELGDDVKSRNFAPSCPYKHESGAESIHMTGHLIFAGKRCC